MEPAVKTLMVKRFRSIQSACIHLDNPTFLVGHNGAGKSNLIDAFTFLADATSVPLQAVLDKRGGITVVRNKTSSRGGHPPNIGLGVVLGPIGDKVRGGRYAFEIRALPNHNYQVVHEQCRTHALDGGRYWFERRRSSFDTNVGGLRPSLDPASLALPAIGGHEHFAPILRQLAGMRAYCIEPGKIREMQDPDSGVSLRRDGSNAASVLQEIERNAPEDLERICDILATIVPCTTRARTVKHGNKISVRFLQEWGEGKRLRFESFNMSDGTLRVLGLLTAVYQRPPPSVLAIEEPEATIHPGAVGAVLDLLRHASKNMQIIVTTHSPDVLDAKWIRDNHLRIVEWREGATGVYELSEVSRRALRQHLMGAGELLRSNALEPEPLFQESASLRRASLFEDLS